MFELRLENSDSWDFKLGDVFLDMRAKATNEKSGIFIKIRKLFVWCREMAQQLRALAALVGDPSLVPILASGSSQ